MRKTGIYCILFRLPVEEVSSSTRGECIAFALCMTQSTTPAEECRHSASPFSINEYMLASACAVSLNCFLFFVSVGTWGCCLVSGVVSAYTLLGYASFSFIVLTITSLEFVCFIDISDLPVNLSKHLRRAREDFLFSSCFLDHSLALFHVAFF